MSQSDQEAEQSAYRLVAFVGQLACIDAERGNRGAIKVASRCYVELKRKRLEVPAILEDFILARLDMVVDGRSKEAFPETNNPANRPREFDGLGFAIAVLNKWINSDVKPGDFKAFISKELNGGGLSVQWGDDFNIETMRRALKANLPFAASLLKLTPP